MAVSTSWHPQPPAISDPPAGEVDKWIPGKAEEPKPEFASVDWLELAQDAYRFSTSWVDSNYRKLWDDSLRMFNNEHIADSPYHHELFRKRSQLVRPKSRAMVRKNEAATAAAFFSNLDRTSIMPSNPGDKNQMIAAAILQEIVQYRLTHSIPWFQVMEGAVQDAQIQGLAVAHIHWKFTPKLDKYHPGSDHPCIDLIPIENFRFDPAADWTDPVNSSPYLIHLIPMYILDIRERMQTDNPKTGRWISYSDSVLQSCVRESDATRASRSRGAEDSMTAQRPVSEYDIAWVHIHIHRVEGQDWIFPTLDSRYLLSDPEPLAKQVFHGKRPYVMGTAQIESHKPMPTPLMLLGKGLQVETNEVTNQRLDNVKLVMNKRYFAKRGKDVDIASLVRNVPGGVTLVNDLEDVRAQEFADVTSSSYVEQDRINADFDELMGNFSAASVQTQNHPNQPARAMTLLQAPANLLTEYMLKTFSETFVVPVLRQLVLLEQYYETDMTVLALAGQKANLRQKYGVDRLQDIQMEQELNVSVNVGMGVTDPMMKLQKFVYAIGAISQISRAPPPGIDMASVAQEIFGLSGYQEGSRFFMNNDTQQVNQAMNQTKQLAMLLKQLQMELKNKQDQNAVKLQTGREKNQTTLAVAALKEKNQNARLLAEHLAQQSAQSAQVPPVAAVPTAQ